MSREMNSIYATIQSMDEKEKQSIQQSANTLKEVLAKDCNQEKPHCEVKCKVLTSFKVCQKLFQRRVDYLDILGWNCPTLDRQLGPIEAVLTEFWIKFKQSCTTEDSLNVLKDVRSTETELCLGPNPKAAEEFREKWTEYVNKVLPL